MDPAIAAGIISGATNLIAGKMNVDAAREAAARSDAAGDKNAELQREFAQNGLRWKIADAHAAGIHPLFALGAQGYQAAPSYVGGPVESFGPSLAAAGQDIGRAIHATRTQSERDEVFASLQLEGLALDNDFKRSQIAKLNANSNPAFPDATAGGPMQGSGLMEVVPPKSRASQPGRPAQEAGAVADYGFARTAGGGLAIIPSTDVKERIEDQFAPEAAWAIRNNILPIIGGHPVPDIRYYPVPKGFDSWKWNPFLQEYRPYNSKGRFPGNWRPSK